MIQDFLLEIYVFINNLRQEENVLHQSGRRSAGVLFCYPGIYNLCCDIFLTYYNETVFLAVITFFKFFFSTDFITAALLKLSTVQLMYNQPIIEQICSSRLFDPDEQKSRMKGHL
jgi:hypothetical protein